VIHAFPKEVHIKQIACGATHCLVLTTQGKNDALPAMRSLIIALGVYSWGQNNQGQIGSPEPVPMMMRVHQKNLLLVQSLKNKNIVQIAAGGYHSLALTGMIVLRVTVILLTMLIDAGEVYGFGAGGYGQLGTGNKSNQKFPTLALELVGKQINFIVAGPSHSIAISTEGKVRTPDAYIYLIYIDNVIKAYLFGRTESRQCNCVASENACVQPVEVSIKNEFFVYAAAAHSCTYLVTVSGKIFSYGTLWVSSRSSFRCYI